ncbi:MAG: MBL fold metallo-hydrolase [Pyrinomonadaceae bacterium]
MLEVSFLDVGQGDAAFVVLPDGTTILIDGGGRPGFTTRGEQVDDEEMFEPDRRSIGEAVVSEYLWWRGLDHIDYVLATHADADHIQGLTDVVRNFRVRSAFVARAPADNREYRRFAEALEGRGVPVEVIGAGDTLRAASVEISVLWPRLTTDGALASGNNDSLVLMLQYERRRVLFTGDVEAAAERQLLAQNADVQCDVAKVAHHGSRTSSVADFVERAHASWAIISVGQRSPFRHPAPEVVERWREQGARADHGPLRHDYGDERRRRLAISNLCATVR